MLADSQRLRNSLREEWRMLIDRLLAAGTPPFAVLETMADSLADELAVRLGSAAAEHYFRDLAAKIHELAPEEVQALVLGHSDRSERSED